MQLRCGSESKSSPRQSEWDLQSPHGTDESRVHVIFDQLVFLRLASPITWGDEEVSCVLGIASSGDGHVEILGNLAELIQDETKLEVLVASGSADQVLELILDGGVA